MKARPAWMAKDLAIGTLGALALIGVAWLIIHALLRPTHELTTAPDGKQAWLISCDDAADCVTESAKVCPQGYENLDRREVRGRVMVKGVWYPTWAGTAIVRCLEPKPAVWKIGEVE